MEPSDDKAVGLNPDAPTFVPKQLTSVPSHTHPMALTLQLAPQPMSNIQYRINTNYIHPHTSEVNMMNFDTPLVPNTTFDRNFHHLGSHFEGNRLEPHPFPPRNIAPRHEGFTQIIVNPAHNTQQATMFPHPNVSAGWIDNRGQRYDRNYMYQPTHQNRGPQVGNTYHEYNLNIPEHSTLPNRPGLEPNILIKTGFPQAPHPFRRTVTNNPYYHSSEHQRDFSEPENNQQLDTRTVQTLQSYSATSNYSRPKHKNDYSKEGPPVVAPFDSNRHYKDVKRSRDDYSSHTKQRDEPSGSQEFSEYRNRDRRSKRDDTHRKEFDNRGNRRGRPLLNTRYSQSYETKPHDEDAEDLKGDHYPSYSKQRCCPSQDVIQQEERLDETAVWREVPEPRNEDQRSKREDTRHTSDDQIHGSKRPPHTNRSYETRPRDFERDRYPSHSKQGELDEASGWQEGAERSEKEDTRRTSDDRTNRNKWYDRGSKRAPRPYRRNIERKREDATRSHWSDGEQSKTLPLPEDKRDFRRAPSRSASFHQRSFGSQRHHQRPERSRDSRSSHEDSQKELHRKSTEHRDEEKYSLALNEDLEDDSGCNESAKNKRRKNSSSPQPQIPDSVGAELSVMDRLINEELVRKATLMSMEPSGSRKKGKGEPKPKLELAESTEVGTGGVSKEPLGAAALPIQEGPKLIDPRMERERLNKSDRSSNEDHSFVDQGVDHATRYSGGSSRTSIGLLWDTSDEEDRTSKEFDKWEKDWRSIKKFKVVNEVEGDLFEQPADFSLAHCVAEDFRMGSGIAVAFKREFKNLAELLDQRVKQGGVATIHDEKNNRYIYYLVTKRESTGKPTYYSMWKSLNRMREHVINNKVKKIATPRLGCGLDRLEWEKVKSMMEYLFQECDVEIKVCNYQQNYGKTKKALQTKSSNDSGANKKNRNQK